MVHNEYTANLKMEREAAFRQKCLKRIEEVCLMDDDFFQVCFEDDIECTQLVLRIIMGKDDLKVLSAQTQHTVANLEGHSVRLDVYAIDSQGVRYDIEVQRSNRGAIPKRARYNSSLMDGKILIPDEDYSRLPESYVIFITEHDVLKKGLPIYHIDRRVNETGDEFGDGAYIIYANASIRDDSPLGQLMEDFTRTDPREMHYDLLKDKTGHIKFEEEGINYMCDFMEELKEIGRKEAEEDAKIEIAKAEARAEAAEARAEAAEQVAKAKVEAAEQAAEAKAEAKSLSVKNALRMLVGGKLTFDEIAEYTNLSLDEVKEFAAIAAAQ